MRSAWLTQQYAATWFIFFMFIKLKMIQRIFFIKWNTRKMAKVEENLLRAILMACSADVCWSFENGPNYVYPRINWPNGFATASKCFMISFFVLVIFHSLCCGVTIKTFWFKPSVLAFKVFVNWKAIFEPGLLCTILKDARYQLKIFLFNSYSTCKPVYVSQVSKRKVHKCGRILEKILLYFKEKILRNGELKLLLCNLIHSFKMKPSKSSPVV